MYPKQWIFFAEAKLKRIEGLQFIARSFIQEFKRSEPGKNTQNQIQKPHSNVISKEKQV